MFLVYKVIIISKTRRIHETSCRFLNISKSSKYSLTSQSLYNYNRKNLANIFISPIFFLVINFAVYSWFNVSEIIISFFQNIIPNSIDYFYFIFGEQDYRNVLWLLTNQNQSSYNLLLYEYTNWQRYWNTHKKLFFIFFVET